MKRILQKSFYRLRTLLLLMVMFVAGSSAWAQDWDVIYSNDFSSDPYSNGWVSLPTATPVNDHKGEWFYQSQMIRYKYHSTMIGDAYAVAPGITLSAGRTYRVTVNVRASNAPSYVEKVGIKCGTNNSDKSSFTQTIVSSVELKTQSWVKLQQTFTVSADGFYYIALYANSNADYYYLEADDFVIEGESVVEETPYTINFVNAPNDAYITLDGQRIDKVNTGYTVAKRLNAESVTYVYEPTGYYADITYDAGSHTFTITYVAGGRVSFGTDFPSQTITTDGITYDRGWSWGSLYSTDYSGYGRIYVKTETKSIKKVEISCGGSAEPVIEEFSVGSMAANGNTAVWTAPMDVVVQDLTFFSTNGESLAVNKITVYYEELPSIDYPVVIEVVGNLPSDFTPVVTIDDEDFSANGTHSTPKTLTKSNVTATTPDNGDWYYEVEYVEGTHTFTVTYKEYLHYNVSVSGCTEQSAGIRVNGNYQTYRDGDKINVKTELTAGDLTAIIVNGWTAGDISCVAPVPPAYGSVSVTYSQDAEQTYTVVFVDAPEGATVTVNNDKTIGHDDEDKTYSTRLTLDSNNFRASSIAGYDSTVELENLTATVTYTAWPKYHVVVTGDLTDINAGVTYNGNSYHNNEYIVEKYFSQNNVKTIYFPYYIDTFTYDEQTKTITVNYEKVDYIYVDFTKITSVDADGVTVSTTASPGSTSNGSGVNIYDGRTISITSDKAIEKIVFDGLAGYNSSNGHTLKIKSGGGSWQNGNSSNSPATWVAGTDAHNVVFTNADGSDMWVHDVKIYVVELVEYTVNFVNAPTGATISVDGVSGTFVNGGHFDAAKGLTPEKVHATCPGYEAVVTIVDNVVTVTFTKVYYVEFVTSGISNTSIGEYKATNNGVTITGYADANVHMLEIYRTNRLVVESAVQPIERIVITRADEPTLEAVSNPAGLNGNEWTDGGAGNVQYVTFTANTGTDNYISKVRVYFPQPVEYTLVFAGTVPENATVTIDGEQYSAGVFEGRKTLATGDINFTWPGYDADVTYDEETSTFTVTYYATTTYDVVVSPEGLEGAAVIYGENEYAAGTGVITCRGTIDEEALSAKGVYGYVGAVSVSGTTITVTYTISEYYDVAESDVTIIEGTMEGMTKFKIAAPAGTTFSEILAADPQGKNVTVNGNAEYSTIELGYENSFITFTNPVMANQYGTFTVEFAAGLFKTADGKKNNAFSYNFENVDPATIVNNYYVTLWGYQYPELAPDGANVTIGGHDGEITTADAYTQLAFHDQIPEFGTATTTLEGYDVEAVISGNQINVYFHKLATVSSYSPENTSNSLDDDAYQYGYSTLTVTFDAPLKEYTSITSTAITASLPDGVTISSIYGVAGSRELNISLSGGNVVGDYSITIPQGLLSFTYAEAVDQTITNAAVSKSWTLTPRTTFSFNNYGVTPNSGSEVANISGITIAAPADVEFTEETKNVTIEVNGVDTQVSATISANQIVLAYNATTPNTYNITIPAGIFTATDGRTNKALTGLTYTIQPTLSINANSVDDKGNYWTTFCLNKDFTLEDGYTPYIVRDNENGGIKLVEVLGVYPTSSNKYDIDATAVLNGTVITSDQAPYNGISVSLTSASGYYAGRYFGFYSSNAINITSDVTIKTIEIKTTGSPGWKLNDGEVTWSNTLYVNDNNVKITTPDYATIYAITVYFDDVTSGRMTPVIPANTGILVKGAAKSGITYTAASGTKADVSGNLLWGCTQSQLKEVGNDQYIYKLAWANSSYEEFGFYWGSANGHSIQANSGKAYLILDANQSSYSNRMLIFGNQDEETTDINRFDTANDNATIYTLQGKPISGEHLPAGIYIKNGRKFIVK